jgi:hypothetical protein
MHGHPAKREAMACQPKQAGGTRLRRRRLRRASCFATCALANPAKRVARSRMVAREDGKPIRQKVQEVPISCGFTMSPIHCRRCLSPAISAAWQEQSTAVTFSSGPIRKTGGSSFDPLPAALRNRCIRLIAGKRRYWAGPLITAHKTSLLAARPRVETTWQHKLEPGRKHVAPDGGEILATDKELFYVGHNGAIICDHDDDREFHVGIR